MAKLCLSCFSKIPTLASRCPNCIQGHQSVRGRTILYILLFVALGLIAKCVMSNSERQSNSYKWSNNTPVVEKRIEVRPMEPQRRIEGATLSPEKPILRVDKPAKKMSVKERKELLKLLNEF